MTQREILEYNKRCAEFLGYTNTTPEDKDFDIYHSETGIVIDNKVYTMLEPRSARFHSDWNWIMEVVDAIEKLGFATKVDYCYCISNYGCNRCEIDTKQNALMEYEERESPVAFELTKIKKEAVVEAINQFLIWSGDKKQ